MSNPPKQKGTAGETELLRIVRERGFTATRTPASADYDVRMGLPGDGGLDALATRPDRGQWLVTIRLSDFLDLVQNSESWFSMKNLPVNIEVKRYRRFALHTIFEKKFGGKK
jgi:hypothetical protein